MTVTVKTPDQIEQMRVAGRLAAEVLELLVPHVKPGVTTEELDRIAYEHIVNVQKAIPANVGYKGFPKTVCTSVNNVICHGIPSPAKQLKEGDIVNIDVTVIKDGWHGDTSRMYYVGEPSVLAKRLCTTAYEAMLKGIEQVRVGNSIGDVGAAVQEFVEASGFSVVREFVGHGIGTKLHEEPQIPNFGSRGHGARLREGMVLAIEPMVNFGKPGSRVLDDKWTAVTADGSLSAHFEHCVAVMRDGPVILTQ